MAQNPFPARFLYPVPSSHHQQGRGHTVVIPVRQLGQHVQPPMGMVYNTPLNPQNFPRHVRSFPDDRYPTEQVHFPTTNVQATFDPHYPTWIHIRCLNGAGGMIDGWIGIQHVVLPQQTVQSAYKPLNARAIVSTGFTQTSMASQAVGCFAPVGSVLAITGMTTDGQWYRLDTNTRIPRSWLQ